MGVPARFRNYRDRLHTLAAVRDASSPAFVLGLLTTSTGEFPMLNFLLKTSLLCP